MGVRSSQQIEPTDEKEGVTSLSVPGEPHETGGGTSGERSFGSQYESFAGYSASEEIPEPKGFMSCMMANVGCFSDPFEETTNYLPETGHTDTIVWHTEKDVWETDEDMMSEIQIFSGEDSQINEALEFNPKYTKLRKQIEELMEKGYRHRNGPNLKVWDQQIKYSQDLLMNTIIQDFGSQRADPYLDSLKKYWRQHAFSLDGTNYKCPINCETFFTYFDIEGHGLILFEEFEIICQIIDPELAKVHDFAHIIFMFLDQSDRSSFTQYDLQCFLMKEWGDNIGKFKESLIQYMKKPLESSIEALHDFIYSEVHRNRKDLSIDLENFGGMGFNMRQVLTPTETDDRSDFLESDPESELITKMRQLRKDISKNNLSAAFGSLVESPRESRHVNFNTRPRYNSYSGPRSSKARRHLSAISYGEGLPFLMHEEPDNRPKFFFGGEDLDGSDGKSDEFVPSAHSPIPHFLPMPIKGGFVDFEDFGDFSKREPGSLQADHFDDTDDLSNSKREPQYTISARPSFTASGSE